MIVYGIKNCDTVKKALAWLTQHNILYTFHDYRKEGVTEELIDQFIREIGLETLINKRSTTWKSLSDEIKGKILDPSIAMSTLLEHPTLMKRPILFKKETFIVGFSTEQYETLLQ